jgi:hypothetical protein
MPRVKHPPEVALWKVVILSLVSFGVFGTLLSFTPEYSREVAITAGSVVVICVAASAWGSRTRSWWSQIIVLNGYFLIFLGFAIRAGGVVFPGSILWPASLVFLYVLAWAIPWLLPRISARIATEQLTPTTPLGRGCQSVALGLIPAVGGLSYLVRRLEGRPGLGNITMVLIATIFSAVAIGASQAYAHQYWQRRPWAESNQSGQAN